MTGNQQNPRIYRYIHVSDDGMAPCSDDGLLTLATCKPTIRSVARVGDWVAGFYPSPWSPGTVSWAAQIARKLDHFAYQAANESRSDAVYALGRDGKPTRLRPDYHPNEGDMKKDLSAPVLIFDQAKTWYFGDKPADLPASVLHLAAMGQGHRVNFRQAGDYERFCEWLDSCGSPGILSAPRDTTACKPCGGRRAARRVAVC
jgi:hypothetical protein